MSSEAVNQQEISSPESSLKYRGRISQIFIYLGKFFRMFIYQSDWKVLPFGAVIAAIVTFVVGANMFKTQEGTINGAFALEKLAHLISAVDDTLGNLAHRSALSDDGLSAVLKIFSVFHFKSP